MPQSLSKILVHIVFSTKNKEPLLQRQIRAELYSYLAGVLQEYRKFLEKYRIPYDERYVWD